MFYISTILILSLFLSSCTPRPSADITLPGVLMDSSSFLPLIKEDSDLRDEMAQDVAFAVANRAAPQAAIAVTTNMITPLKVATLYRLSIIAEESGDHGSALRAFLAGEKGMDAYPLNTPRVPDIYRAAAYAVMKNPAQARERAQKLGNDFDRNEALARILAQEILHSPDPLALPNPPVITEEVASAWCDRAIKAGPDQSKPYMEKALLIARDGFPVFRPRMLIDCAKAEGKLGNNDAQEMLLREAGSIASALGDRTETGSLERARVGIAMAQAGMRDAAREVLEQAAVASRLCASYFQPPAMVMVAEGWWELGEKERANAMWLEAAKVALAHPHPNARAVNAIHVLLSISKYQQEIFPELAAILERIKRGEGGEGSVNLTLSPEIQDAVSKTQKALYKNALEKDKQNAVKNTPKDSKTKKQK
jgi:tetratricopeptide (TPR) repeat protein